MATVRPAGGHASLARGRPRRPGRPTRRTAQLHAPGHRRRRARQVEELEDEDIEGAGALAKAIRAQTAALTRLVRHRAQGDPLVDR
eukprot:8066866-Heterocapsa_arctica.AAC.1